MSRRTLCDRPYPRFRRTLALAIGASALALAAAGPAAAHHTARPHKPSDLRVVSTTATTIVLAWDRTARRFALSRNYRPQGITTRARHTFRYLECGKRYRLAVRALNRAGTSAVAVRWAGTRSCELTATQPPQITGTARVGRLLHATTGGWSGAGPMIFAYAWLHCGADGEGCSAVPGATGPSYFLTAADRDSRLRVEVTATNPYGSKSSTTAPTAVVADEGGSTECSRADATGCAGVVGSRISLLNARFSCDRPLAQIAAENPVGSGPGTLPLLVEVGFTTYVALDPAVVELKDGCVGDQNDETIDLVIRIEGDGRTVGGTSDAIKVRLTARDVQLTGYANCGPRGLGADGVPDTSDDSHQDGAQIQGGDTVEFIDFEWGDWETNTATCQGAAGTFVPGSVNGNPVTDMACIRCKSVSCNHGMLLSGSTGSLVVDSKWRVGNPADRSVVLANGQTGLCHYSGQPCTIPQTPGHIALEFTLIRNYCDDWPYEDG